MSVITLPDLTGRKVGEYEIVARIGVGGMGVVYEGRQPLIGKRVAVKVLLPSLSNEGELVERFLAEARSVNEIRHRGIVDIFSFGQLEPEGSHYFVMEYLDGEAFDKLIKKRAPMPFAEALIWAEEILDALDAAHSAGIIHRDIKPSNLFLVNTGRGKPYIKLLDFGIAKLGALNGEATPQTRASVILGTPDYISPEQARGKPISPQTDLYALGCVLFEMLTAERVFRGENTLQTMWMHVEDPPPVPSSIRPDIPRELDDLILWALEKEASNRPPSASVMRDQLQSIRAAFAPTGQHTPPPLGSGSHRPVPNTPPPSGRLRAGSTPAPRSGGQVALKTPQPGNRSNPRTLSGRHRGVPDTTAPALEVVAVGDEARVPETRLAPLTAMTGARTRAQVSETSEAVLESGEREAAQDQSGEREAGLDQSGEREAVSEEHAVESGGSSKLTWILVAVLVVLAVALGALYFVTKSNGGAVALPVPVEVHPDPTKTPEQPDQPTKPPSTVAKPDQPEQPVKPPTTVAKPDQPEQPPTTVTPPTTVAKPEQPPKTPPTTVTKPEQPPTTVTPPTAVAKPEQPPTTTQTPRQPVDKPDPKKKVITAEQLTARYRRIEAQLAARESETGQKDPVLRQFLQQAQRQIESANTDPARREAWGFLGDIESQLKH